MQDTTIYTNSTAQLSKPPRVSWVDVIKGICIVSVVAMWVDGFLELRTGWLHEYVVFSRPFRMPDFFLVSGLFLDKVIDRPWKTYIDRKVLHYLYFVILWSFFTLLMRDWIFVPPDFMSALGQYAYFIAQPFTSLWFITMLPIYFVVTRLTNGFSRPFMLVAATALFIFRLDTGVRLIDNFGKFYIFFLFGYFFAQQIFAIADWLFRRPVVAIVFLLAWLVSNIWVTKLFWSAWDDHLIMLLVAGIAGVLALIALSQLMAVAPGFQWLSYLGANSITVYLGFYIPMLFTGFVARRIHLDLHTNFSSILVWLFCISAPVLLHLLVRGTRLDFIFHRPRCFRLS